MLRNEESSELGDRSLSWSCDIVGSQNVDEDPCKKYEMFLTSLSRPPLELQGSSDIRD